jgi:hypothetical protein
MAEKLQTTLIVPYKDDNFEFKIPSIHNEIAIGSRMSKLRAVIDPDWDGFSMGLDGGTQYSLRACAAFELLLQKSSAKWPFSPDDIGAVKVDSSKFPPENAADVVQVYQAYQEKLTSFRSGGAPGNNPLTDKVVESQPSS